MPNIVDNILLNQTLSKQPYSYVAVAKMADLMNIAMAFLLID